MTVVALVGVGGLGCPAALCLARAGVSLRLLDEDRVERANLHRQVLFGEGDIGRAKVDAAVDALRRDGAAQPLDAVTAHVTPDRALDLLRGADVVVEGSDNFATKFLVADACAALCVPVVHGACVAWRGTVLAVRYGAGACYRCVFEDLPTGDAVDCATAGVYGPVTSVVGALMAAEALRLIAGDRDTPGTLSRYDGWAQTFRASRVARRRSCAACGDEVGAPALTPERYFVGCGLSGEPVQG